MNKRRIFWGGVIILFSALVFIALSAGYVDTLFDYRTFSSIEGSEKFGVVTSNPVGVFGLIVSFWGYLIFGNYFVYLVNFVLLLFGLFLLLPARRGLLIGKLFGFFLFSTFIYFFLIHLNVFSSPVGVLADSYLSFFSQIFGKVGSAIVSLFVSCFFLVLFLELKKIFSFFDAVGKGMNKTYIGTGKVCAFGRKIFSLGNSLKIKSALRIFKRKQKKMPLKKADEIAFDDVGESVFEDFEFADGMGNANSKENQDDTKSTEKIVLHGTSTERKENQRVSNAEKFSLPRIEKFLKDIPVETAKNLAKLKSRSAKISAILEQKLAEFGVEAKVVGVNYGPVITQFELRPSPGVKVSRFISLQDDLSLALKAFSIRVQAPIPGEDKIGIELPNEKMETITLRKVLDGYRKNMFLPIALGVDIVGSPVLTDLAKTPHLLIAGATGSGKSVCINTIINSLLFNLSPDEMRMIMIDPKKIELSGYADIPHLLHEIITLPEDSLGALNWAAKEMDERYHLLQKYNVRDLRSFNKVVDGLKQDNLSEEEQAKKLPYIVLVVDEFADLIMTAGKDIEKPITRLAQMGRAVGFHLILATQRPSTQVITGIIKANFPSRIAFRVSSKIDSRVILDANGAEKLLGRGDMLFLAPGKSDVIRVHGAYISDDEIENVVEYLKTQPKPKDSLQLFTEEADAMSGGFEDEDDLFVEAAKFIVESKTASVSMLQRHFKIGYARAGRLIDLLEQAGIIGPHLGSKPREVRATEDELRFLGYV